MAIKCSCGKELTVTDICFTLRGKNDDTLDVEAIVEACPDCIERAHDDGVEVGFESGVTSGYTDAEEAVEELVKNKMRELGYDKAFEEG